MFFVNDLACASQPTWLHRAGRWHGVAYMHKERLHMARTAEPHELLYKLVSDMTYDSNVIQHAG